ncbi:AAC(3) family N-acetyltransferase [Candidatus Bathyarchaeota archaeon]|nr:AAC(3) family N-acetyltransferase [Candidatus Bathyarchaeota archaeon]
MPYDPERTSCWTGIIPESFRKRHNAFRSVNPTHSIAAIGSRAKEIIEAAKKSADKGYKRVLELDGYALLIGTRLDVCSAMHLAESHVQLPRNILEKIQPPQEIIRKYGEDLGWPRWDKALGLTRTLLKLRSPAENLG